MTILSKDAIISQLESADEFPIAFSDVWEWLGYTVKGNAKRALLALGFVEGTDLIINDKPTTMRVSGIQAHPEEEIFLTIDCFKLWAMSAQTEKGKEVRIYYLSVEKEWRKTLLERDRELHSITPDHVAAYDFDRAQFQPWKDSHPIASEIFLSWQSVPAATPLNPVKVDPTFVLPSKDMQEALGNAFLNLNRSGLAMNKLFKFVDRIPTMQKMDSQAFKEMQEALQEAGETIHRLQDDLRHEKNKTASLSRTMKGMEETIKHLEVQIFNLINRTTSSAIEPITPKVERAPKGTQQKQMKSAI